MGTLVCFHAHPDDEAIGTGGTLARAAAEGHRVVLVIATNGEWGEVPDDLAPGETLADRRRKEAEASCAALGVHHLIWLGYEDSGMTGWAQNQNPGSFWQASLDEAAELLAAILRAEQADVVMLYDWHGVYGHPDHIKVHQVGIRAAEIAGTPRIFQITMNRDSIVELQRAAKEMGQNLGGPDDEEFDPSAPADDGNPFGSAAHELTLEVDVSNYIAQKRTALKCHKSQITDTSFFMEMPDEIFTIAFGKEHFIEWGVEPTGPVPGWIF